MSTEVGELKNSEEKGGPSMYNLSFDWLEKRDLLSPNKVAMEDLAQGVKLTYREFNIRCNRLANAFRESLGVKKGDRIAILALNCFQYLEALFAVGKIGAILVPVNIRLTGKEIKYIFDNSRPKAFILVKEFFEMIETIKNDLSVEFYISIEEKSPPWLISYEKVLGEASDMLPRDQLVFLDDPQVILYTSGTTGYPKGAIQTHGNIFWNSVNTNLALDLLSTDVTLTGLPLFHTGGLHVMTTPTLHVGGTVVIQRTFDPGEALSLIHDKRLNTVFFVATMWLFMMQHEAFQETDFSGLRLAWSGGAPCPISVIEAYQKKGVCFRQGYGLTEVGPVAMVLSAEDAIRKAGSIGFPPFHSDMRLVDDEGRDVGVGEVGELVFRGPHVTPGYWENPGATREAIRNGWFHTGDLAKRDEDGFVYIVDRKKDMIISGGENIYPVEIENVLYQFPRIGEVAIIGVPDERWGEVGKAIVVLKEGQTATEQEILDFLREKVAKFKIPKSVEFISALPRNPAGKVLKRTLREKYWMGYEKRV